MGNKHDIFRLKTFSFQKMNVLNKKSREFYVLKLQW